MFNPQFTFNSTGLEGIMPNHSFWNLVGREILGKERNKSISFVLYIFLFLLICIFFCSDYNSCITLVS